jgi:hypothetical protein
MTLFDAVSKQEIFAEAIAGFYPDGKDPATIEILRTVADGDGTPERDGTLAPPVCSFMGS